MVICSIGGKILSPDVYPDVWGRAGDRLEDLFKRLRLLKTTYLPDAESAKNPVAREMHLEGVHRAIEDIEKMIEEEMRDDR